jgi:hypothetical protein
MEFVRLVPSFLSKKILRGLSLRRQAAFLVERTMPDESAALDRVLASQERILALCERLEAKVSALEAQGKHQDAEAIRQCIREGIAAADPSLSPEQRAQQLAAFTQKWEASRECVLRVPLFC